MNTPAARRFRCVPSTATLRCVAGLSLMMLAIAVCVNHSHAMAGESKRAAATGTDSEEAAIDENEFQPSEAVKAALLPLFTAIADAERSRAKVELTVESVMHGEILSRERSTFQIASKFPNQYTIYHKSEEDSQRIYSDGKTSTVALSPHAYYELPRVWNNQSVVTSSPIHLGPYPEPMLALSLAGVDPSISFFGAMASVEAMGKTKFRGLTDSIHLHGQQDDGVVWDLWITDDEQPRPLRVLVNLTPMLQASNQVHVPEGYELSLRYDFVSWRVSGDVDDNLFRFAASEDAIRYDSLADYEQKTADEPGRHPLLGKPAPPYTLTLLDGTQVSSADLKDKIVVLDFWATWCVPCIEAMPVIQASVDRYADQNVVFYAVNAGENTNFVSGFVSEQDWEVDIAVDPEGALIDAFVADEIPLTFVIGANGIIESAHMGFAGEEALKKQFNDELEVLVQGGRIASFQAEKE